MWPIDKSPAQTPGAPTHTSLPHQPPQTVLGASLVAQRTKNPPAMQETRV